MKLIGGFHSDEQRANFFAAGESVRRGAPNARICGARTKGGGVCRQTPLKGAARCLRHAGPYHARLHRQRQLKAFAQGKLSLEDFERFETRRAVNALRSAWRRDPWTPGETIDLGEHEDRFQLESGLASLSVPIAPAVLDWLRWRYRRLQIDRRRDSEWARVVREDYPRRLRDAGSPPPEFDPGAVGSVKPRWSAVPPRPRSKRLRDDQPHAPPLTGQPQAMQPSPFDEVEVSDEQLARVAYDQRDVLAPLLGLCAGTREQRILIRELAIYLDRPTDLAAMRSWTAMVSTLRERA